MRRSHTIRSTQRTTKTGQVMTIDNKSSLPRSQQIAQQIKRFTTQGRIKTKLFVSTDDFKEMRALEKLFGSVYHENAVCEGKSQWQMFADHIVKESTSPSKFRKFLATINDSKDELQDEWQQIKKASLESFLQRKKKVTKEDSVVVSNFNNFTSEGLQPIAKSAFAAAKRPQQTKFLTPSQHSYLRDIRSQMTKVTNKF